MDKKEINQKVLFLLIIIVLIICIILACIIHYMGNSKKQEIENEYEEMLEKKDFSTGELESINNNLLYLFETDKNGNITQSSYFTINECLKKYLYYTNIKNELYYARDRYGNETQTMTNAEIQEIIYNLLSRNYINKNKITKANVFSFVKTMEQYSIYVPLEEKQIQDNEIKSFIIHGLIEDENYKVIDEIYAIINLDIINEAFSIEPIYEKYNNIAEIKVNDLETKIEKNNNNTFKLIFPDDEKIMKEYIDIYKKLAIGNPKILYNMLDEEYRKIRFKDENEFEKYLQTQTKIKGYRVVKYQKKEMNGYTQYEIIDQFDNYYLIKDYGVFNYSYILDNYNIEIPEIKTKYLGLSDEDKIKNNIQIVFQAINLQDNRYVYKHLDATFKTNNYSSIDLFEKFVKQNFFDYNVIDEIINIEKSGHYYICTLKYKDGKNVNSDEKNITFIMQLKEGTDFVMSFSME